MDRARASYVEAMIRSGGRRERREEGRRIVYTSCRTGASPGPHRPVGPRGDPGVLECSRARESASGRRATRA